MSKYRTVTCILSQGSVSRRLVALKWRYDFQNQHCQNQVPTQNKLIWIYRKTKTWTGFQKSISKNKILTLQQTWSYNIWHLEPRLFFFRLAYSIKYFVRSSKTSMKLDFRGFENIPTQGLEAKAFSISKLLFWWCILSLSRFPAYQATSESSLICFVFLCQNSTSTGSSSPWNIIYAARSIFLDSINRFDCL